jgi:hypothetical protein
MLNRCVVHQPHDMLNICFKRVPSQQAKRYRESHKHLISP